MVKLQALKISQSLGDESSQVGGNRGVDKKPLKKIDHPHPRMGYVTYHVYRIYISGVFFDVPMVSDRFCLLEIGLFPDPFQLA